MGFCLIADVELFLGYDIPAANQPAVQAAIDGATAAIRDYCHQWLSQVANDVITLDGGGGTRLYLPERPVTAVAQIAEDGDVLTVIDDYIVGPAGQAVVHRVGSGWARGVQNIEVTYTHGYTVIPSPIVHVCARAASRIYQAGLKTAENEGVPGVISKSLGDYSVTFGSEQGGGAGGESLLGASAAPPLLRSEERQLAPFRFVSAYGRDPWI